MSEEKADLFLWKKKKQIKWNRTGSMVFCYIKTLENNVDLRLYSTFIILIMHIFIIKVEYNSC